MILFFPSNLYKDVIQKVVHTYNIHASLNRKGKKGLFLRSEKIGKKCCDLCCRAACITRYFFKTQNPRLINKSSFKSRAAYEGARTVLGIRLLGIYNFGPNSKCLGNDD